MPTLACSVLFCSVQHILREYYAGDPRSKTSGHYHRCDVTGSGGWEVGPKKWCKVGGWPKK